MIHATFLYSTKPASASDASASHATSSSQSATAVSGTAGGKDGDDCGDVEMEPEKESLLKEEAFNAASPRMSPRKYNGSATAPA